MSSGFRALLLCLLLPVATWAQVPNVDSLRTSLAEENDTALLRKRAFELSRRTNLHPEVLVERGMVFLRLYQLTDDKQAAKLARTLFDLARRKFPRDPQVHYGLGLSRIGGYGVRSQSGATSGVVLAQSIAEIIKKDPISLAKNDFKTALQLDSSVVGAAVELARLSIDTNDRANMEEAAVALRRSLSRKEGAADVAMILSELESALGNVQAASRAAERAMQMVAASSDENSISSATLAHAIALIRQKGQEEAGAKLYFDGTTDLNETSARAYFSSLSPITSLREQEDWDRASLDDKKEFLKRFWNPRAAAAGVTVAERLAEHYRRLATAQTKYRHESGRGAPARGALVAAGNWRRDLPFDDRGLIYIRHGEPATIVRTTHEELRPNETWVYDFNGKYEIYNFVILPQGTDYRLVDDILIALEPVRKANDTYMALPTDAAIKLLQDRQVYEPRYGALAARFDSYARDLRLNGTWGRPVANWGSDAFNDSDWGRSINLAATRIASELRDQALIALKIDTDRPHFKADMPFYYDLYSFKGANGLTDVTATAAIPGKSLFSQRAGGRYIYSLQASLIFIDTATNDVARHDTTWSFRSTRMLNANEYVRVALNMAIPYSKAGIHRIVLRDLIDPGVGQLYGGPSELHNFGHSGLMISDIVLAEPGDGLWTRGRAHLALVPPRQFEEKKPLKVFYEIYNLPPNTPYRTEISMISVRGATPFGRLKKLLGGGEGGIRLQFDGTSQPNAVGTLQELRQVTTDVKPGKYRIEVRVTNLHDRTAVVNETMFIVGKKE